MSLLEITGLTHSFGENLLYKNAGFTLNKMEHIGIVGQNGTGKSTLIKICTEQIIPDSGRVIWQPNITIGYLDQYAEIDHTLTVKEFLKSAFAKLFEIETQVMQLYEKAADGDMKNLELAAYYQEQLETHGFCQALDGEENEHMTLFICPSVIFLGQPCSVEQNRIENFCSFI